VFLLTQGARADWINLIRADQCESIIEVYVEDEWIRITLEIGEKDFEHFKWIIPEQYYPAGWNTTNRESHLRKFFDSSLILMADGKRLEGEVQKIESRPRTYRSSLYTGKIDTLNTDISSRILFVDIRYKTKRPGKMSITPPIEKGEANTSANIGFVTYHKNLPVNDLRYLSTEETLILDWKDPWYSKFLNRNLARHHKSSFMSFLYVEDFEVRHELVVRVKDLDHWLDLDFGIDDKLDYKELDSLRSMVTDFLIDRNKVIIDGVAVSPILDKAHFIEVKLSGIQILDINSSMDYASAILGVIFVYPQEKIPQRVEVHWDLWSDQINKIPCVMHDPAGPMPYDLTPDDATLVYTNYLTNHVPPTVAEIKTDPRMLRFPFISLLILGFIGYRLRSMLRKKGSWKDWSLIIVGLLIGIIMIPISWKIELPFSKTSNLSPANSYALVNSVLKNVYRSFDFKKESDIYDKLSVSVSGDLLSEIYIQAKQSMVLEQQGGIQVNLDTIHVDSVEPVDDRDGNTSYKCNWKVTGKVGHWGHIHRRMNQYAAILRLNPENGVWKLHDIEILEEIRLN